MLTFREVVVIYDIGQPGDMRIMFTPILIKRRPSRALFNATFANIAQWPRVHLELAGLHHSCI